MNIEVERLIEFYIVLFVDFIFGFIMGYLYTNDKKIKQKYLGDKKQ